VHHITDPNHCQGVLAEAFADRGPALIEATVDSNEPPLPPKVTFAQTRHMVEALVRGTPDGAKIAKQLAKDTIRQLT
jgi:pyruvate dehydrogenase (quinone)